VDRLEGDFGRENLRFPKEIILLGGAPGAGKGTNTAFIHQDPRPHLPAIVIKRPARFPRRQAPEGCRQHGRRPRGRSGFLLRELMKPAYRTASSSTDFPRTNVQVECLKLLVDKMQELRREFYNTPLGIHFRQPTIHIMVLFVDERESIARQAQSVGGKRAPTTREILRTGIGPVARGPRDGPRRGARPARYRVFKEQTWDALQSLKELFHYHFINAQGTIAEVEQEHPPRARIPGAPSSSTRAPSTACATCRSRARSSCTRRQEAGEAARQL